jgi:hypothetical protein
MRWLLVFAITVAFARTADAQSNGQLSGKVLLEGAGTPIAGVSIRLADNTGVNIATAVTDGAGAYSFAGLAAGSYFLTTSNVLGYVDELYPNLSCAAHMCYPVAGTPVAIGTGASVDGINFELARGSTITGTVSDAATGVALAAFGVAELKSLR